MLTDISYINIIVGPLVCIALDLRWNRNNPRATLWFIGKMAVTLLMVCWVPSESLEMQRESSKYKYTAQKIRVE